ncbi:hypothetical protein FOHLNKBM_5540 [Methylobacterium longum]|uniref:MucR family transcriptional regulator n=1 Tax=Methylobacterium longum TaxID=767694 RepID=UPI001EE20A27|nr:MucR family transcriptional regulator [Methylobacterium longum]GJE14465.1 hypothetical protein FOHLNKBM_5540 [Methylobacterium longum]
MDENAETIEAAAVDYVELTAEIVSAYVSKNPVRPADMAELITSTHAALAGLAQNAATATPSVEKPTPAQIRKSITPDALISFIDGKPYKMLKRHLTGNGMTIEQYRQRYGLPPDYPTTSANHSAMRAEFARSSGLGQLRRKAAPKAAEPAETVSEKPKRAGRPRKANVSAEA